MNAVRSGGEGDIYAVIDDHFYTEFAARCDGGADVFKKFARRGILVTKLNERRTGGGKFADEFGVRKARKPSVGYRINCGKFDIHCVSAVSDLNIIKHASPL